MALFLQESVVPAPVSDVTIYDAMHALMEAQSEIHALQEGMLRADFVLHEETRLLREAGEEEKASGKEKGFVSKVWTAIKALADRVWNAVKTAAEWLRKKAGAFWAKVKEKYAQAKAFVIGKGKIAKARAVLTYHKAVLAAKTKVAALLNADLKDSGDRKAKIDAAFNEVNAARVALAKAGQEAGSTSIAINELKAVLDSLTSSGDAIERLGGEFKAMVEKATGDGADAARLFLEHLGKAGAEGLHAEGALTSAKPANENSSAE